MAKTTFMLSTLGLEARPTMAAEAQGNAQLPRAPRSPSTEAPRPCTCSLPRKAAARRPGSGKHGWSLGAHVGEKSSSASGQTSRTKEAGGGDGAALSPVSGVRGLPCDRGTWGTNQVLGGCRPDPAAFTAPHGLVPFCEMRPLVFTSTLHYQVSRGLKIKVANQ